MMGIHSGALVVVARGEDGRIWQAKWVNSQGQSFLKPKVYYPEHSFLPRNKVFGPETKLFRDM